MPINIDPKKIEELLTRGVEKIVDKDNLIKKLKSGKQLRIKLGIDPTGPKIHIGRAIQFWKLRAFQELGHQIVLIIGDFTALIGDASDKQAMRKSLTEEEIKENMKDYKKQIGKILDLDKVEFRNNGDWFSKMGVKDFLKLEMNFTAQQMIQRKNFEERWNEGKPIGLHELNYPLLQGYDSVAVKSDVEIGGSDQLFNVLTGREIQKIFDQEQQDVMTSKMLNGLDGRKMSTSWGNIITIVDEPNEMFGKIMSMHDELIGEYFELCTRLPSEEVVEIKNNLKNGELHPKDAKVKLGKIIISIYYSENVAIKAEEEFNKVFKDKKLPSEMPEIEIKEKSISILDLLAKTKLAESKSEAQRLVGQKGVKIDGEIWDDWKREVEIKKGMIIQVGKRRFIKII